MIKQFVTYEIAKILKELNFREKCFATYKHVRGKGNEFEILNYPVNNNDNPANENTHSIFTFSAPLWQQAIDWLREEKIVVLIDYFKGYRYTFKFKDTDTDLSCDSWSGGFMNYEQARETAIKGALIILKTRTSK